MLHQIIEQKFRANDDPVLHLAAFFKQTAQRIALPIRKMLPPKKRIAERQSRADPVFLKQRQHLAHIDVRRLDASAAPKAARRRTCYEAVSRKNLGEAGGEHRCVAPDAKEGYRFSKAMKNPGFIGADEIKNTYLPMGFSQFKIEGRGLGSALILEFLLYYLTRPEHRLEVREAIYLDNMLDLF